VVAWDLAASKDNEDEQTRHIVVSRSIGKLRYAGFASPYAFVVPDALKFGSVEFLLHRLAELLVFLFFDHLDGVRQIGLHKGIEDHNIAHGLLMIFSASMEEFFREAFPNNRTQDFLSAVVGLVFAKKPLAARPGCVSSG
jgi:hypothetical protein